MQLPIGLLDKFIVLIDSFLNNTISALEFEKEYLVVFKNDSDDVNLTKEEWKVLNNLFFDVSDFCSDSNLRNKYDIDEIELRKRSQEALEKLRKLKETSS